MRFPEGARGTVENGVSGLDRGLRMGNKEDWRALQGLGGNWNTVEGSKRDADFAASWGGGGFPSFAAS